MNSNPAIEAALANHPCYNEEAHRRSARIHIPVAPACNIQCNYCNRKFDCCNESRPGVSSELLSPRQASDKIAYVKSKVDNLNVVGIAGPGDPLANESTFESLEIIAREHPEMTLCVSTNGLALPENAERLYDLGVRFLTVTMNACDPEIGAKIYGMVLLDGTRHTGVDGASILIDRQTEGIRRCVQCGMVVKVNIVMIPGINTDHIPDLVKYVKGLGAYIVNILPLIPVQGTAFENLRAPTPLERRELMDKCSLDAKMMRHCRQCRADAIGLIGEDRSQEFVHIGGCGGRGDGCGPSIAPIVPIPVEGTHVAIASKNGVSVDSGFGNAAVFRMYSIDDDGPRHLRDISIDLSLSTSGSDHRSHIESIVNTIGGCGTVVVREIGHLPAKVLDNLGIRVVITDDSIDNVLSSLSDVRE